MERATLLKLHKYVATKNSNSMLSLFVMMENPNKKRCFVFFDLVGISSLQAAAQESDSDSWSNAAGKSCTFSNRYYLIKHTSPV